MASMKRMRTAMQCQEVFGNDSAKQANVQLRLFYLICENENMSRSLILRET